jgi:DNA-binding transcriptional LysR family regulator
MLRSNLDVDLLQAFSEVAHTRSFTQAAERLNRVQSAVSGQIKRLESVTGVRLFDRTRRSVKLTKEGEILLDYAQKILRLNDAALSDLGQTRPSEKVRLAVSDHSACFLPQALVRFAAAMPAVQLEIRCERSWDALDAGDVDLAFVTQPCGRTDGEVVYREQLVWAAAEKSEAPAADPLPLAIFGPGCVYRDAALRALDTCGRAWRIAYNSPSRDGLLIAVRAGLAVTVATESTLESGLAAIDAHHALPVLPEIELSLHRQSRGSSSATTRLWTIIQDTLGAA